jgi:hypothetical protein
MLMQQHIELHNERKQGFVGMIQEQCKPYEVAQQAFEAAKDICLLHVTF